jgi:hypothetical protein
MSRAGRRDIDRPHPYERSTVERLRAPLLALLVLVLAGGGLIFVFASAAAPAYACTSIDTAASAAPAAGELGQVQPDMGNGHVQSGDKITYPVCPPASGKHVSKVGYGPLTPKVYGPDDQSIPNGWVHNLEHGGLVLLYSCTKGACDAQAIATLQAFSAGFPASAICGIPAGSVGPVIARFEEMPTRFAALIWDRVLYLDTLDKAKIGEFYTRYAERLDSAGKWVAPPEPQCAAPTPSTSAAPTPSPS